MEDAYEHNIAENQFGFRRSRSTSDAIWSLRQIVQKYNGTLIIVYVDLKAAYDRVPRDFLFKVLTIRTGAHTIIALLQALYKGTTASISGLRVKFDVLIGCRQGGQESPSCFNYYFDYVLKVAALRIDKAFPDGWGTKVDVQIPYWIKSTRGERLGAIDILRWILYADDLALFTTSVKEAEELLKIIDATFREFGLTIAYSKTKTQVFNDESLAGMSSLINIGQNSIENVREFCYLGHLVTNRVGQNFTELRISRANAKFYELARMLKDSEINMGTRKKVLEACVRSRLVYACQAWYPNEKEIHSLEVCWYEILRKMISGGFRRKNQTADDWRYQYSNKDLEAIIGTCRLRDFINIQYLRYVAHVCRRPNTALIKRLFFAKSQKPYYRNPWIKISQLLNVSEEQAKRDTQSSVKFSKLLETAFVHLRKPGATTKKSSR